MTKQVTKCGKSENRSPAQLLADYAFKLDADAGALWQEYAVVMRGQRQLYWTPGLRDELGLREEKTDAELVEEIQARGTILALLTLPEWRAIVANDSRAELLAVAGRGDAEAVRDFIAGFMADCVSIGDIMALSASPPAR